VGTDAISNAMIYQPDRVTPVGEVGIADQQAFVNPLGATTDRNRPAIAQAFEVATGDVFVAVVNHLKSKGSGCGAEDPETRSPATATSPAPRRPRSSSAGSTRTTPPAPDRTWSRSPVT
jgi:predicted extracellular nuclease